MREIVNELKKSTEVISVTDLFMLAHFPPLTINSVHYICGLEPRTKLLMNREITVPTFQFFKHVITV